MDRVAVVILNYNGKHYLERFLPQIIAQSPGASIYVADNASTDGSVEYLQNHFPVVRVIPLDQNYGFCGGYNNALQQVKADYYALINSDLEVTSSWLEKLVSFLDNHPQVGACQPKILDYQNRDRFEYAGAAGGFIDQWGYPFCRGRIFDDLEKDDGQYNENMPVFWATGACLIIRSNIFHQLGGFDTLFFAHLEEIDLCWRMQLEGHQVYCVPASKVFHVGGGTLPKNNPMKTYLNFRNSLLCIYKNSDRAFRSLLLRCILDPLAAVKFMIQGQPRDAWAVARAGLAFFRLAPKIKQNRKRSLISTIYKGSVVWDYFVRGKRRFMQLNFKNTR